MKNYSIFIKRPLFRLLRFAREVISADKNLLARRALLMVCDCLVLAFAFWASFALRLNAFYSESLEDNIILLPVLIIVGLATLISSGWYRSLTRASGSHSFYSLLPRTTFIVLALLLASTMDLSIDPPRSFWFLLWSLITAGLILSRILARDLIRLRISSDGNVRIDSGVPTLIYGAGEAGFRLLQELSYDKEFRLVAVVDDSPILWNRYLQWLPIVSPETITDLIRSQAVQQVLLALPSASVNRRRVIANELTSLGLKVLTIPSLSDIASGRERVSSLKPISINDLLGRDTSKPLPTLLLDSVKGKSVMVTGAGGSIGSELCRQILNLEAKNIVLIERSEYALYSLYQELLAIDSQTIITPVLADVCDQSYLELCCNRFRVQIMIHAAAYKHVPLVEKNICIAVKNNLCSTQSALLTARKCHLEKFTLVSTDKAVRPTNVMGASKRLCELLVQDAAAEIKNSTENLICSMVRFGNVLGSSGSVVPLFRQQIVSGGPVTVTHPDVTRYFMTIPEAVQLVLQASAMAEGGEVFILDMGEPVKISDLARQMIQLSGFSVQDDSNPSGDIKIEYTGLRPGEKLFEELLIGIDSAPTNHPLISKANESNAPRELLVSVMEDFDRAFKNHDTTDIILLMNKLVPEYLPDSTTLPLNQAL